MQSIFKIIMSAILSLLSILGSIGSTPPQVEPEYPDMSTLDFTYLKYPNEAVKTLSDNDISLKTFKNRATDGDGEYDEARGHDDANGVVVSPYYTLKINGNYIPVYSTVVFVGDTETGELHSFSEIYIKDNTNLPLNIELISEDFKIKNDSVSALLQEH